METAVLWYRKKIGGYDLQIWERAVELQEKKFKGIEVQKKRDSCLKTDLIDVDLVRGSTFSKNKPQLNVVVIVWMGLLRMIFLPVFFRWWIQQANIALFCGGSFLYFWQLLCLFLYATTPASELSCISLSEVALPSFLMLILGLIHCQVVSTYFYQPRQESLPQKRTLSKALLEPAKGVDCKNTLSFVTSSVRNIDCISVQSTDDQLKEDTMETPQGSDSSGESSSELEQSTAREKPNLSTTALLPGNISSSDRINIRIWEGDQWKKCHASLIHIGGIIIKKVDTMAAKPDEFCTISVAFPFILALLPAVFRLVYQCGVPKMEEPWNLSSRVTSALIGNSSYTASIIMLNALVQRFVLSGIFFIMLCAAQQTFKKRFLYSKYFTHLTSSRRAKKSLLPHFRLKKVQNIRVWLALRSYLRRRGPQRSVDVIVSSAFLCSLCLLCFVTIHLMSSSDMFVASLMCWDSLIFLLVLGIFILQFITIGAKINKKYHNISTLLTEQINLHLQMERKPHKKERLNRANSVLTLAAKLIKEIEEPFNIYGLAMSPIFYNITRVVLLSALSGVVSEMLGFKLKIWKIKT